jgi:acyl-CoA dehydrogenase
VTPVAMVRGPIEAAKRIAESVAAPLADAVDRDARFPSESMGALREEGLLGAFVPRELGGLGASFGELAGACEVLGRACASTAMIFAMHQIEVACLVRHGLTSPFFRSYLAELARQQWLIASATSERGTGGDLRQSICALERHNGGVRVIKHAPVISYGEEADAILLTARRTPDAAAADQVLVLLRREDMRLTPTAGWDALGMRGTRSLGFTVGAGASADQVLPVPFADVASQTMVPASHVLWSSLWLGIASDAVGRARASVRVEARRAPASVPPSAQRLAEIVAELDTMSATVHAGVADYERHEGDVSKLASLGFAIRINNLKVSAARLAPSIVAGALGVCGISGYKNDSPYAVGRHLRDAHSASLMISNDRVLSANARMLLVHKDHGDHREG